MEIANHECYVSLEVAKLLKKAGFDWDTYSAYNKDGLFTDKNRSILTWNDFANYYSAPTLDVAQRWLREVKNYEVFVVVKFLADKEYIARVETNISGYSTDIYKFYEEAQETGIKKALEMILEKGE